MINELVRLSLATLHRLPDLDADTATRVARSLVPEGTEVRAVAGSPLLAREAGLATLARLRGVLPPRLPPAAFPAALEPRPLHTAGWLALGVDPDTLLHQGTLERGAPARYRVASEAARAGALARLVKRAPEAQRLADAWSRDPGPERHAARARALLLAEETGAAFAPAVRAALEAERAGRFREARDWLVLVDALPRDRASDDYARLRFALAACRAGVAAAIGSERARDDLVASALARATTEEERGIATLLAVDLARRKGDPRAGLVAAMKVLGRAAEESPTLAVRAGLRVAELRLALGEPAAAATVLDRVEELRGAWRGDVEQIGIDALRAEVAVARGDVPGSIALNQRGLRLAAGLDHQPGIAAHSLRLGLTCWWRGDRLQAEAAVERARRARIEAGERGGAAEAAAWLGWLLVSRGDAATAGLLGQEALVVARRLNLVEARGLALAVLLAVATARGDAAAAWRAIEEHATAVRGDRGPFALAAARWWRAQGQATRALEALEAAPPAGFFAVEATLERARARLARQERNAALELVEAGRTAAIAQGFAELDLYARLLRTQVEPVAPAAWDALAEEATTSAWVEVFLWILALDGDRKAHYGDYVGARQRFLELAARATEHGHAPFRQLAAEALGGL